MLPKHLLILRKKYIQWIKPKNLNNNIMILVRKQEIFLNKYYPLSSFVCVKNYFADKTYGKENKWQKLNLTTDKKKR